MKCPECHNLVNPNDKFCPSCGSIVEQPSQSSTSSQCHKCGKKISTNTSFCENCGAQISQEQKKEPKRIISKGAYSGKMNTGKSKLLKRLIITAIIVIVISVMAIIIWFQVDDNAEDKLKEALRIPGTVVIIGFAIYVAIFGKSKKGRSRGGYDDDDDDYDDGGDDGDDDD